MNVPCETPAASQVEFQASDSVVHTNKRDPDLLDGPADSKWRSGCPDDGPLPPLASNSAAHFTSAADQARAFDQPPPVSNGSRKRASVLNRTPSTTTANDTSSQETAVEMPATNDYYGSMQPRELPSNASAPARNGNGDDNDDDAKLKSSRTKHVYCSQIVRTLGVGAAILAVVLLGTTTFYFSRTQHHSDHTASIDIPIAAINGDTTRLALLHSLVASLDAFKEPEQRISVNGELNTTLHVGPMHFEDGPISFWTRAYEGSVPGPTLRVKPGDTINIELVNDLEPNVPGLWTMNTNHNPNTTNLHVHGMHVDPTGIADNIFRVVSPGESALTQIHVPRNHPRGLFHYHPHYHGSVFAQMGGGMVGALVVDHTDNDDDHEEIPEEYRGLKQQVLVMQEFRFSGGLGSSAVAVAKASRSRLELKLKYTMKAAIDDVMRELYPDVHQVQPSIDIEMDQGLQGRYPSGSDSGGPSVTDYFTVNGQYIPKIELQPRENRILRFVNAGGVCALQLSVPGCSMTLAATDGIYLTEPRAITTLLLATGSRADVVFNCEPNSETLEPLRPLQSVRDLSLDGFLGTTSDVYAGVVAMIHVKGASLEMALVTKIPTPSTLYDQQASLLQLSDLDRELMDQEPFEFEFTMGGKVQKDGFTYKNYWINGKAFDGESIHDMPLGIVQEWVVVNKQMVDGSVTQANHPFHLHTNAFQIVAMSHGEGVEYRIGDWRDVISVPTPGNVTIRFRPVDFTGKIVAHCHVLGHSDGGMIAAVAITH